MCGEIQSFRASRFLKEAQGLDWQGLRCWPPAGRDDVTHGEFADLVGAGARDVGHRDDPRRSVAGRRVGADPHANPGDEVVIEFMAWLHDHEENDADIAGDFLADGEALLDFLENVHLAVDLGGAYAHAAGIEHGGRNVRE